MGGIRALYYHVSVMIYVWRLAYWPALCDRVRFWWRSW